MVRETGVQSQVGSYHRFLKWYLIPTCLTLSIIRYVSRVKWSNPGKGLAPSSPRCSSYWKGSLPVALDYGHQLYFYFFYPFISCFFCIEFLFKNFIVCVIFSNQSGMTRPGIEPRSSAPLANALLIRPMARSNNEIYTNKK